MRALETGWILHKDYWNQGYAGLACRLVLPVARAHEMKVLLITNDHANKASRRVCEKLGARLVRTARLPDWHDLYKDGRRFSNIFEWRFD